MSIAKKSTKWLLAAIVVFALALTAFFAVGGVATAKATEPEALDTLVVRADVQYGSSIRFGSTQQTIDVVYYVDMPDSAVSLPELSFAPILTFPGAEPLAPTFVAINPAFDEDAEISRFAGYAAGTDDYFLIDFAEGFDLADADGVDGTNNNAIVSDNHLFTATYTIPSSWTYGICTVSFAQYSDTYVEDDFYFNQANFATSDGTYELALQEETFPLYLAVNVPTADSLTYNGDSQIGVTETDFFAIVDKANSYRTDAGTNYQLTVSLTHPAYTVWNLSSSNYPKENQTVNWSIAKRNVTVTFDDDTYYGTYGTYPGIGYAYDGLVSGDQIEGLGYDATDYDMNSVADLRGASVGTYYLDLTLNPQASNPNYNVTANDSATYIVEQKDVYVYFDDDEYESEFLGALDAIGYVYLDDVQGGEIDFTGLAEVQGINYYAMKNNAQQSLYHVGEYTLVLTLNGNAQNPNYDLHINGSDTATYTITPKYIAEPAQDSTSFTYNGSEQTYSVAASDWYSVVNNSNKQTDAGHHPVQIALTYGDGDTLWATAQDGDDLSYDFYIAPKAVTVTFNDNGNDYSTPYGTSIADQIGFVVTDNETLTGVSYEAKNGNNQIVTLDASLPRGTYTLSIKLTANANPNYTITATDTALYEVTFKLIEKPAQDQTHYEYIGTEQTYIVAASDWYFVVDNSNKRTDAGTQTVTIRLTDTQNTRWSDNSAEDLGYTFRIYPKGVSITFDKENYSSAYGAALDEIDFAVTGAQKSDIVGLDYVAKVYGTNDVVTLSSSTDAGFYTLSITVGENPNYAITHDATALYTINRIAPEVNLYSITNHLESAVPTPHTASGVITVTDANDAITVGAYSQDNAVNYIQYQIVKGGAFDGAVFYMDDAGARTDTVATTLEPGNYYWVSVTVAQSTNYNGQIVSARFQVVLGKIEVTLVYLYNNEEVEALTVPSPQEGYTIGDAIPVTNALKYFATQGFVFNNEIVTEFTAAMAGQTLQATISYDVGKGDVNGDGVVNVLDLAAFRAYYTRMSRYTSGAEDDDLIETEAEAWAKCLEYIAGEEDAFNYNYVIKAACSITNNQGKIRTTDIVAMREAFATGYSYSLVEGYLAAGVSGQAIIPFEYQIVHNVPELVASLRAGLPTKLADSTDPSGAFVGDATADVDLELTIPVDLFLNGQVLMAKTFRLVNNQQNMTLHIYGDSDVNTTDTIYATTENIVISAPNGNVKISNVFGYVYEGNTVTLEALDQSLHIENNVAFYVYRVDGYESAAELATDLADATHELNDENSEYSFANIVADRISGTTDYLNTVEEKKAAVAAIEELQEGDAGYDTKEADLAVAQAELVAVEVKKAPITIPVSTHVVVEEQATLVVEKINVTKQSDENAPVVTTFSIDVKSTQQADVIPVDITEVKEIVEDVNVYYVESVEVAGEENKVEIISAEDQTFVAAIGATKYMSFEKAVAAAQNGDTVVLLANVTYGTDHLAAVWDKTFNLDLNGYTYTSNSTVAGWQPSAIVYEFTGGSVTVSNGTVVSANGSGIYSATNSVLTLEDNLTVTGGLTTGNSEYCAAIRITEQGTVTVNGGTYTGTYALVVSNSGGTMIVNDGLFNGKIYFSDYTKPASATKTITINGGDFRNVAFENANVEGGGTLTIYGGTFDADPTAYVPVEEGYVVSEENGIYTVTAPTVVTTEAELRSAVAAGASRIVLGADIRLEQLNSKGRVIALYVSGNKDIVLDLNGHTLASTDVIFGVYAGNSLEITGTGTLLYDGTAGSRAALWIEGSTDVNSVNESYLTIGEDVTVDSYGYGVVLYEVSGTNYCYGVVMTVNGTIIAERASAICAIGNIAQHEGDVVNDEPIASISKIIVGETASLTSAEDDGIYAAGFAIWDIRSGVELSGTTALYAKSGYITIGDDVVMTSTRETKRDYEYYGNGGKATGDGIVIDCCYYPGKAPILTYNDALLENITVTATGAQKVATYWAVTNETQLNEALAANAPYIYIRNDFTAANAITIDHSVTIVGNNHTITSTATEKAIAIAAANINVTIKNLNVATTLNNSGLPVTERGINIEPAADGVTVTLTDVSVDVKKYALNPTFSGSNCVENATIVVDNCYLKAWGAINAHCSNSTITVTNSTLYGINRTTDHTYSFSTITIDGSSLFGVEAGEHGVGNVFTLDGCTIIAEETYTPETWISFQYAATGNVATVTVNNCQILDGVNGNDKTCELLMSGTNNAIVMPLTEAQFNVLNAMGSITVTANGDGIYTITPNAEEVTYFGDAYNFYFVFEMGWLEDGESFTLTSDVVLNKDVIFAENRGNAAIAVTGGSFTMKLAGHTISGDGKIVLPVGVTCVTDSATSVIDIFAAEANGYEVVESLVNGKYVYTTDLVEGVIAIEDFEALAAAIAEVNAGTLVDPILVITDDIFFEEELEINKSVTIYGNGHVFYGYEDLTIYGESEAFFVNVSTPNQTITINGVIFDTFGYNAPKAGNISILTYGKNCVASTTLNLVNCEVYGTARDMIYASSGQKNGCVGTINITGCTFDASSRLSGTLNMLSFYGKPSGTLYVNITGCTFTGADKLDQDWASTAIASFGNAAITINNCTFEDCQVAIGIDNCFDRLYETSNYPVDHNTTVTIGAVSYLGCDIAYYEESVVAEADVPANAVLVEDPAAEYGENVSNIDGTAFTYGTNSATAINVAKAYKVYTEGTAADGATVLVWVYYYVEA